MKIGICLLASQLWLMQVLWGQQLLTPHEYQCILLADEHTLKNEVRFYFSKESSQYTGAKKFYQQLWIFYYTCITTHSKLQCNPQQHILNPNAIYFSHTGTKVYFRVILQCRVLWNSVVYHELLKRTVWQINQLIKKYLFCLWGTDCMRHFWSTSDARFIHFYKNKIALETFGPANCICSSLEQ